MLSARTSSQSKQEIDIWLIRDNLKLSYEERVAQHQNTLDCITELKQIGLTNRAKPAKPSQISRQKPD